MIRILSLALFVSLASARIHLHHMLGQRVEPEKEFLNQVLDKRMDMVRWRFCHEPVSNSQIEAMEGCHHVLERLNQKDANECRRLMYGSAFDSNDKRRVICSNRYEDQIRLNKGALCVIQKARAENVRLPIAMSKSGKRKLLAEKLACMERVLDEKAEEDEPQQFIKLVTTKQHHRHHPKVIAFQVRETKTISQLIDLSGD